MNWFNLLYVALGMVFTFCTVVVPFALKLRQSIKARNEAKTEAEKEKATNEIRAEIKSLVANAEVAFEAWDKTLKAQNHGSAGPMKKRDVILALKTFCLEKGHEWDDVAMNKAVDDEVAYTKTVNVKK